MCPSRVAVNGANRKEVAYSFTAEEGDVKPKLEIEYEGVEVKDEKPDVEGVDGVDGAGKPAATVDTISVKPEPL